MIVGVPKEAKRDEYRVALLPVGVEELTRAGHTVLFETGAETELDSTICVACSRATQLQRLRERGWTADEIQQRVAAQWPVEKKMARADFVIWSEGSLEVLAEQLKRIIR